MARTLQNTFIRMIAAAVLLFAALNTALAANFATQARHAILIDAGTGEVLFEKSADALMPLFQAFSDTKNLSSRVS